MLAVIQEISRILTDRTASFVIAVGIAMGILLAGTCSGSVSSGIMNFPAGERNQ